MPTLNLNCNLDASISSSYPDTAYNQTDRLAFGRGGDNGTYQALLNFPALGLSNVSITSAILTVTKITGAIGSTTGFNAHALQITGTWGESTDYTAKPATTPTGASPAVATGSGYTGTIAFDITNIVTAWNAGAAQRGVLLEKVDSGGTLIKCIADRTSGSVAYITVTYEYLVPAPTVPVIVAPGTITTDNKTFDWSDATDRIFASSQLMYEMQISLYNGATWGGTMTTAAGVSQLIVSMKSYLAISPAQYYYNSATIKIRVRTKTPAYSGTVYYSAYATSAGFAIDYRVAPSAPATLTPSKSNPYEGEAITFTVSRPATYNTPDSTGATQILNYRVKLAGGAQLVAANEPVTSASKVLSYTVGNLTSGADLSTNIQAYCVDADGQVGALGANVAMTIKRSRAPIAVTNGITRTATGATVNVYVPDTGFGGAQVNTQISKIQYKLGAGAWTDATLIGWSGLYNSFALTGLDAGTRYVLQIRAVNVPPTGLTAFTGVAYTATVLEYIPAFMPFRDSGTGVSGAAAQALIVGSDYGVAVAAGCGKIQNDLNVGGVFTAGSHPFVPQLAIYDNAETPDTTLCPFLLTSHATTKPGTDSFYYYITMFYGSVAADSNRFQTAYQYTGNAIYNRVKYAGTWTAWAIWSSDWANWATTTGGITLGDGTIVSRYCRTGKTIRFLINFTLGSTSAIIGGVSFSLPVNSVYGTVAIGRCNDATGATYVSPVLLTNTACVVYATKVDGVYATLAVLSSTIPMTWATGDSIYVSGSYEMA